METVDPDCPILEISHIDLSYHGKKILNNFSLTIYQDEIVSLLGPSACGKTTLLKCIAGLEPIEKGYIKILGKTVHSPNINLPIGKRNLGMVFQDNALFPHLTVYQNIIFGIQHGNARGVEDKERVDYLLKALQLDKVVHKYPHEISGGQQQRTSLARSIAPRPRLILMDEPFTGQDVELKEQVIESILHILQKDKITALVVTHDQIEAFKISHRIGVMNEYRLDQLATPREIYHFPSTRFVANFIGSGILMEAIYHDQQAQNSCFQFEQNCMVQNPKKFEFFDENEKVLVLLRPEDVSINHKNSVRGVVIRREFRAGNYLYKIKIKGKKPCHPDWGVNEIFSLMPTTFEIEVGEEVGIKVASKRYSFFKKPNDML